MDNVTHTLVGLMLARCGLGKSTPGGTAMMMLSANAPDIDVASGFGGSLAYIEYHRGYTHALVSAPVLALILLLFVRLFGRGKISWTAYLACLAGVLSHLALDYTNVYGVRLLLPFSARRLAALPARVNPLLWRGVVEAEDFVVIVPVDLMGEFDPSAGRIEYSATSGLPLDAARHTPAFEGFGRFAQLPFWKMTALADATRVELIDLRFGTPRRPGFEAIAVVDAQGDRESV